jgi:hypothetical protein
MFPRSNLAPESVSWANAVQDTVQSAETRQPILEQSLDALLRDSNSSTDEILSRLNAYYTNTLNTYPIKDYSIPMSDIIGNGVTRNISAPASSNNSVAETWVTVFSYDIQLNSPAQIIGARLNTCQMRVTGSASYSLRYRWMVNTSPEGINNNRWMSRHEFHLPATLLSPTGSTHTLTNHFVYRNNGSASSTYSMILQASIQSNSNLNSSVPSQSILFEPYGSNGLESYLDVMVTV